MSIVKIEVNDRLIDVLKWLFLWLVLSSHV